MIGKEKLVLVLKTEHLKIYLHPDTSTNLCQKMHTSKSKHRLK